MSNTLNNVGTLIAQKSLDLLVNQYPALSLVASDFSDASAPAGSTIKTRVITPGAASDFSSSTGYLATDLNSTAVNVVLNKHKHSTFSLSASDLTAASSQLINDLASKVSSEIGDAIYSDICGLFTTGSYGNSATASSTIVPTQSWGFTGVINAANTALNKRKVGKDRIAIYNSDLYGSMFNDSIVRNDPNKYIIGDSSLPQVQKTVLTDYSDLPTTSNLVGVQLHKSAVALATRLPEDVSNIGGTPQVSNVTNVVHPELGIGLQVRSWEDPKFGSLNVTATLMYGVAVGNSGCAQLIRTA